MTDQGSVALQPISPTSERAQLPGVVDPAEFDNKQRPLFVPREPASPRRSVQIGVNVDLNSSSNKSPSNAERTYALRRIDVAACSNVSPRLPVWLIGLGAAWSSPRFLINIVIIVAMLALVVWRTWLWFSSVSMCFAVLFWLSKCAKALHSSARSFPSVQILQRWSLGTTCC